MGHLLHSNLFSCLLNQPSLYNLFRNICRNVNAWSQYLLPQQQLQLLLHLAAEIQPGPTINGVMMKTTIQAAILMAELVVIITTVDGINIAQ